MSNDYIHDYRAIVQEVRERADRFTRGFRFIVDPETVVNYDLIPLPRGIRRLFFNRDLHFFDIYRIGSDMECEFYTGKKVTLSGSESGSVIAAADIIERQVKKDGDLYVFYCTRYEGLNLKVELAEFHPNVDII